VRYLIGIGNYYGYDDSIGLRVAEVVAADGLDEGFTAIELGGNLLDLLHYIGAETECVLIVDSARMGLNPGDFAFFTPDKVVSRKEQAGFSTHEGDLMKILEFAAELGQPLASITILGIEPQEVRSDVGMSPLLADRLPDYVHAAVGFFSGPPIG